MLKFKSFNPLLDNSAILPNSAGNYIVCLRSSSCLPEMEISPILTKHEELQVVYVGASVDIKNRDYRQHFNGTAGRSTLRKSLGVLFGYKQIPRDKSHPDNGKTKFSDKDEQILSEWMKRNIVIYFALNTNYMDYEQYLIDKYNPPFNLLKNRSPINLEFRKLISSLRSKK